MSTIRLTPQQQAVVNHNEGPALVFAVAGAGKTTAMVHRLARLVRQRRFPAHRILATSFGRANVQDLRSALAAWPDCRQVAVRTLHALGRDIIRHAQAHGYQPGLDLIGGSAADPAQRLLGATVAVARRRAVPFARELDSLDRSHFLDYVGFCKGNLLYAPAQLARRSPAVRQVAGSAPPPARPLGWYVDLLALFEEIRQRQGIVTFDDMLLTGWELLVDHQRVRSEVLARYRCLVVDEFQDINRVQSELLHLLAAPHGNYMAVGDDDQTIYEWRGARPAFILDFQQRYGARTYLISENFRCPAGPLLLANAVIQHNRRRRPKQLSLTRGLDGETAVVFDVDVTAMSRRIAAAIDRRRAAGVPLAHMAVLVRLNAQTPPIEQELLRRAIPYRVSQPFYRRAEIRTLIHYGRLAWLERARRQGRALTPAARLRLAAAWRDVCNRPPRHIAPPLRRQLGRALAQSPASPSQVLHQFSRRLAPAEPAPQLAALAALLAWLAGQLLQPAEVALAGLIRRLDYLRFVQQAGGFSQTAAGRAASVANFLLLARGHDSLLAYLQHLAALAAAAESDLENAVTAGPPPTSTVPRDAVTLSTIHQAKGLEWPVVFVVQCNDSIMPFNPARPADIEEERRLFYVALTRSRGHLALHLTRDAAPSRFLDECGWARLLPDLAELRQLLARDPAAWDAAAAARFAWLVPALGLQRYFARWWPAADRAILAGVMVRFLTAVDQDSLWDALALDPACLAWWRRLLPAHAPTTAAGFPGLAALAGGGRERGSRVTRFCRRWWRRLAQI